MARLFRAMKESANGLPEIGPSSRTLGVRPGIDVQAHAATDFVSPGQGRMSVSPDDPLNLPIFRRPAQFQGTGKDPVWVIAEEDLPPALCYRPDSRRVEHGFIEPARPVTLVEYQQALASTQTHWKKAVP